MGDNGLSGKKLVMDAYGPMVPIGGGAYSGKDPHKVDRVGPVLARDMALHSVIDNNLPRETVSLTWAPGQPGYTSILSASGNAENSVVKFPKNVNECYMKYFSDSTLREFLKDLAVNGWYSGNIKTPWETGLNKSN